MKNILLAAGLLSIASIALANETAPFNPLMCGTHGQHCTTFEDHLEHPASQGYLMQHTMTLPNGDQTPPHEVCVSGGMKMVVKAKYTGTYTEHWKMHQVDEDGTVYYRDYATQTFFVMDDASVRPARQEIFIDSAAFETNCPLAYPPSSSEASDVVEIAL